MVEPLHPQVRRLVPPAPVVGPAHREQGDGAQAVDDGHHPGFGRRRDRDEHDEAGEGERYGAHVEPAAEAAADWCPPATGYRRRSVACLTATRGTVAAVHEAPRRERNRAPSPCGIIDRCPSCWPCASACPRTSRGARPPCARRCGSRPSRARGWPGGSTSTATARATSAATAASSAPSSCTRSSRTATGSTVLGRDDFVPGQFGENFTVDGLADDEVCIGDRYRIGGAVFEVTPAPGHLLPGRRAHERAPDGGADGVAPAARLLPAGHDRGTGPGRRRDRQGRVGSGGA